MLTQWTTKLDDAQLKTLVKESVHVPDGYEIKEIKFILPSLQELDSGADEVEAEVKIKKK